MSAVQAGGGKGSGQRPGGTPGGRPPARPKPSPGQRGASGTAKGSGRRPPAPGRKPGSTPKGGSGGGGGGKGRSGGYAVGPPRRFSPSTLAFVAVGVVVVIIVALVIVKVTGSSPSSAANQQIAPVNTPAPASLVNAVTGVPTSVAAAVGVPSSSLVAPPTVKTGQPPLTIDGKPAAVFVGAEFCPLCAAERWAIIMAFGKFGTFSNLQQTTSSPWDSYPDTPTFSFYGATYTSPYITLDTTEHESNDSNGENRTTLQPLTALEAKLWAEYDGGTSAEGFPFLDIGNKVFVLSPSYNPQTLAGMDQKDVASKLTNAKSPVTQSIVGTANYLTAAICATTGQKPASVCSAPVLSKVAKAMKLS